MTSMKNVSVGVSHLPMERIYCNDGNASLIDLLDKECRCLLDIGCGAGDNAALIKSKHSKCDIFGITYSTSEAALAQKHMAKCWVIDIEDTFPDDLANKSFDGLLFSHVLEHVREPALVLARFSQLLCIGGRVLIAVPNVLSWRMRLQFLLGDFRYQSEGVLDDTHLHFFTYFTADQYLLAQATDLEVTFKVVTGNVPLWWFRRHVFPREWSRRIDQWGCRHWPNLFGSQVIIQAVKL